MFDELLTNFCKLNKDQLLELLERQNKREAKKNAAAEAAAANGEKHGRSMVSNEDDEDEEDEEDEAAQSKDREKEEEACREGEAYAKSISKKENSSSKGLR